MSRKPSNANKELLKRLLTRVPTFEEADIVFGLDPESLRRQERKEQLQGDFYAFMREAFAVLHPGDPFRDNWHIRFICEVLQSEIERIVRGEPKQRDVIINVPPRSLKSFICTVCLPAWAWTLKPSLKFIGSSYSAALSVEHCVSTRRIVQSDWYQQYWGDSVRIAHDQDEKSKFINTQLGLRMATSTGGSVTGGGCDCLIIDDPTNPEQAASEVERETANRFFRETLSTRLNNPETGLFVVVQQRLHENDLTGYLLTNEEDKWFHVCLPAELTADVSPVELRDYYSGGYLFPQRFTKDFLSGMRTRLGSYGYAGQMLQRPTPPEGGILKGRYFKRITMDEFYRVLDTLPSRPGATQHAVFADTAYTAKQNNDPSALIACVYAVNTLYILAAAQVWKELPDLLAYVPKFLDDTGFPRNTPIRIEPKATGISIVQGLRSAGYNAVELPAPKDDKITRAHAAAPFLEAGRCVLVEGPWVGGFVQECEGFPNGHHDDQVDVLTAAVAFFSAKPTVQRTHGSQRI